MCEYDQHGAVVGGNAGFVDDLVTAMVNGRIYFLDHPRVTAKIGDLLRRLQERLQTDDTYTLGTAEGYLVVDQRPLLGASLSGPRIINALEQLRCGAVQFSRGATASDVRAVLEVLGRGSDVGCEAANAALVAAGAKSARFLPSYSGAPGPVGWAEGVSGAGGNATANNVEVPMMVYQNVVDVMQNLTIEICRGHEPSLDLAQTSIEQILAQLDSDPLAMLNLARYEHYDAFTFGHSIRVCLLAMQFARTLAMQSHVVTRLGMVGLLHDVGKARIPFEILQSRGRLSADERKEMERHTVHGGEILLEMRSADPWAVTVAFGHHRTKQGGYPTTAGNSPLSLATKLVKICDVYEALTAVRPYKLAMEPVRAYRIMLASPDRYDPGLLHRFVRCNGVYPIGSMVSLSDGTLARVERQSADLRRPIVRIEFDRDDNALVGDDRMLIDLSRDEACPTVCSLDTSGHGAELGGHHDSTGTAAAR